MVKKINELIDKFHRVLYHETMKSDKGDRAVSFICECPEMKQTYGLAQSAATTDATVLLFGETGTGKEVFADFIWRNSERSGGPYVKVNCAALPAALFESELFGYERGAFTGADPKGKDGFFFLANGGTLLLDEIGEIPLSIQPKLLRALQSRQITKVGGTRTMDLDVRIIATTNQDLHKMVDDGAFRRDLFYRINIINIHVPPLRERREDLRELTGMFLAEFNGKYGKRISLCPSVHENLAKYDWPGNVRELANLIERWVVIFEDGSTVRWDQLGYNKPRGGRMGDAPTVPRSMRSLVDEFKRDLLMRTRGECRTVREMAERLQVDHSTIVKLMKKYEITPFINPRK